MSEPEKSIAIKGGDLEKAEHSKKKAAELQAAIALLQARLGDSEYPSRAEVSYLVDKLAKSGASMVAMASW